MRARVCWSAQALETCRCGRCIAYRNSINVCVLSGRQPLGSNCRGTSKWGVLTLVLGHRQAHAPPSAAHEPPDSLSQLQQSPLPAVHGCRLCQFNEIDCPMTVTV